MSVNPDIHGAPSFPRPSAVLELLKPITWFPPMWAYMCGVVSSGLPLAEAWGPALLGILVAGPLVCGMSQAANDWCDRHVDAINEPGRPIPSGRLPGRSGLAVAWIMSGISLVVAWFLGPVGFAATVFGILCAWAYSAEPVRLKRSWLWGPGIVGLCYEGLPWITGAAAMAHATGTPLRPEVLLMALLYAIGAHGIMTLNDFKAMEGDRLQGVRSMPVVFGPERAARILAWVMALPQMAVILLLLWRGSDLSAAIVSLSLGLQALAMRRMFRDPRALAPWYNGTGVMLYVLGMLATALALGGVT